MRLTQQLLVQHKGFWFKQIWKKKSKFVVLPSNARKSALKNATVVNAVDEFFPRPDKNVWIPPEDPRFMFPPSPEDNPNWHVEKELVFNDSIRLWEGVKQAQLLTHSVVHKELPSEVIEQGKQYEIHNQDLLMQRIILQANLWDTTEEKLTKREKPKDISIMNYKTEIGITPERTVEVMLNSIALKCAQSIAVKNPKLAFNQRLVTDHIVHTRYIYMDKIINLSSHSPILLCGKISLSPYADANMVSATTDAPIPDMFPMASTVDLDTSHIYPTRNTIGYSSGFPYTNHHLLFLPMKKEWSMEQRHAGALMASYAHAIEKAYRTPNVNLEQKPITIQTIHTDGEWFGYTCFQLNTMDTDSAVKNISWVDHDLLYEKVLPRRSMLRNTKYRDYNDVVVKKIMGLFARE